MNELEILKKLGMIEEPKLSWNSAIEALSKHNSPQAQRLLKRLRSRVDNSPLQNDSATSE